MDFSATITPFMPLVKPHFVSKKQQSQEVIDGVLSSAELFSSGRDALLRALKLAMGQNKSRRIFLPNYFCPWVIKAVESLYCAQLCFYDDVPTEKEPDFSSLLASGGDIVVAVNFFASRDFSVWEKWKSKNKDVILIADFSHCPFAEQIFLDCFDYVFASLRKTLPLSDGGYLFGRNFSANAMYKRSGQGCDFASVYAFSAALAEIDYQSARDYYYNAEMRLNAKNSISRISFYSYNTLKKIDLSLLWDLRSDTFDSFNNALSGNLGFSMLQAPQKRNDKFALFCPTLVFDNVSLRDRAYAALSDAGILPSIYWGAKFLKCKKAKAVSSKMMTISLDFRHTEKDAQKVAEILNNL